ncbi:MAG: hypothetical protein OXE99_02905 [Cellvibrionales bacterium]|nr:hypothetical protein [Cellvibrionales bacterium]
MGYLDQLEYQKEILSPDNDKQKKEEALLPFNTNRFLCLMNNWGNSHITK